MKAQIINTIKFALAMVLVIQSCVRRRRETDHDNRRHLCNYWPSLHSMHSNCRVIVDSHQRHQIGQGGLGDKERQSPV